MRELIKQEDLESLNHGGTNLKMNTLLLKQHLTDILYPRYCELRYSCNSEALHKYYKSKTGDLPYEVIRQLFML